MKTAVFSLILAASFAGSANAGTLSLTDRGSFEAAEADKSARSRVLYDFTKAYGASEQYRIFYISARMKLIVDELVAAEKRGEESQGSQFLELYELGSELVDMQLKAEAQEAGFEDRNGYLEADESFQAFIAILENTDLDSMDQVDLLVFAVFAGARLQAQTNIRFVPYNYFENLNKAEKLLAQFQNKLGL